MRSSKKTLIIHHCQNDPKLLPTPPLGSYHGLFRTLLKNKLLETDLRGVFHSRTYPPRFFSSPLPGLYLALKTRYRVASTISKTRRILDAQWMCDNIQDDLKRQYSVASTTQRAEISWTLNGCTTTSETLSHPGTAWLQRLSKLAMS